MAVRRRSPPRDEVPMNIPPTAMPPDAGSARTETRDPPRIRLIYMLPALVFLALAVLFLIRLYAGDPSRVPSALIGRPVPSFALDPLPGLVLNGQAAPGLSDAALRSGEVSLVNVWASWCGPCRQEHPALMQLAKDSSVRIVGINYKDSPENARRFLGALGNPFTAVGVDPTGRTAIDWGVYGVPESFLVGPDGRIRYKHIGPVLPEHMERLREELHKARRP